MPILGKIEPVLLREIWRDEAKDFTPWLASEAGMEMLGDILGVDLELIRTESLTGLYRADILARISSDEEDRIVIIENQLEKTDHDHLGKIITYASGHEAVTCVWVASSFTEEHRKSLDWLNENMPDVSFFGLEICLVRIGNSDPAPQFTIISSPNEWAKAVRASQARGVSDLKLAQMSFWEDLIEAAQETVNAGLKLSRNPRPQHWYEASVGRSGIVISLTLNSRASRIGCEIYISSTDAKKQFDTLYSRKSAIEAALGYELEWQRLDERKASRIVLYADGSIDEEDDREAAMRWMLARMNEFYRVFQPIVMEL